jgi:hypothetical protein
LAREQALAKPQPDGSVRVDALVPSRGDKLATPPGALADLRPAPEHWAAFEGVAV